MCKKLTFFLFRLVLATFVEFAVSELCDLKVLPVFSLKKKRGALRTNKETKSCRENQSCLKWAPQDHLSKCTVSSGSQQRGELFVCVLRLMIITGDFTISCRDTEPCGSSCFVFFKFFVFLLGYLFLFQAIALSIRHYLDAFLGNHEENIATISV